MSLELMTLALLAPRSANWANGPGMIVTFVQMQKCFNERENK